MKSRQLDEAGVEAAALDILEALGYASLRGGEIAPGEPGAERGSFSEAVLGDRFRESLRRLNPDLPAEALEEAVRRDTLPQQPSLLANNRALHRMLVEGVAVECRRPDGSIGTQLVQLVDFHHPDANDWW